MLATEWVPVGTRGGCGAGWRAVVGPGGNVIPWGLRGANGSHPNQNKHQAPSSTPPAPCPYRTLGRKHLNGYDSPIRSSTFIRRCSAYHLQTARRGNDDKYRTR